MDPELKIAAHFVKRLLDNPALHSLTPLQKEEQIAGFLKMNANQLYPTLSSSNFFPGKNINQVMSLLVQALMGMTDEKLIPLTEKLIKEKIDFNFTTFFRQLNCPITEIPKQIFSFMIKLLKKPEARRGFTGPYIAISMDHTDKYIEEVFKRKEYLHFEFTKVQRLKMGKEEIKQMVKTSLLLKTAINLLAVGTSKTAQEVRANVVQQQFADKVLVQLKNELKLLPEDVLKSALNSNLSFIENHKIETTSRMAAIFAARCRDYKHFAKIDRGADTPDKSWFNIARRNYKFYGFDVKMLDEFYKISAENNW